MLCTVMEREKDTLKKSAPCFFCVFNFFLNVSEISVYVKTSAFTRRM